MEHKFLLALVWIVGAAVVASLAYAVWDLLKWLAAQLRTGWQRFAPVLGAACALPMGVRAPIRIKVRRMP